MSLWGDISNPFNKIFNSTPFKVMFPVNALAQGLTKAVTGQEPASQYATGATIGSGMAGLHALMGPAAASSGMTPYMPTSAPGSMGSAGITTGPGGMFSPLNPMSSGMGASAGGPSSISKALSLMRMMPSGGGGQQQQQNGAQQRQNQEMQMRLIYQMFPNLRPGSSLGGQSTWQS